MKKIFEIKIVLCISWLIIGIFIGYIIFYNNISCFYKIVLNNGQEVYVSEIYEKSHTSSNSMSLNPFWSYSEIFAVCKNGKVKIKEYGIPYHPCWSMVSSYKKIDFASISEINPNNFTIITTCNWNGENK